MKMLSRLTLVISLVSIFTISANAQQPAPTPSPDDDVVVITTNLVKIDVSVTDKDGKVVTDLKPEDFEIYENGKLQPITDFSFVWAQAGREEEQPAVASKSSKKEAVPVPVMRLRPEQVKRTIALVVDDLTLSFPSAFAVRSDLKKFVDEQMQPGDLVAIIRTAGGIGTLQQFTSDKRMLYAAIDRIRWFPGSRGGPNTFAPVEPNMLEAVTASGVTDPNPVGAAQLREFEREAEQYRQDMFAVSTLGAVNYVVNGMRELPGRKAVVLFSDGFKLYSTDRSSAHEGREIRSGTDPRIIAAFDRLTDLANRASVIIYTVDARGLFNPMLTAQDNVVMNQYGTSTEATQYYLERSTDLTDTQQGLRVLAQRTGGFSITNNNFFTKGLQRVLNDQNAYYLLGYQPEDETFDSSKLRFNNIVVKVKRPDLRVRYRSGFFGVSDEAVKSSPKTPYQQIRSALTSPFSTGQIDLSLTSLFADDSQAGNFMHSLIYVKGSDLTFTEDKYGWQKATFDIVAVTFGDNGNVVDEAATTRFLKVKKENLAQIREQGVVYNITFPVKKPGLYQMRVVVRDTATSRIGSASQFIEVPNLKKDRLALSGIFMHRTGIEFQQASTREQLQQNKERDAALRRFKHGETVRFDFSAYNAEKDKSNGKPRLVLQYKIFREGKELFVSREHPLNSTAQSEGSGAFRLEPSMPAGDYVLQVIVKDTLARTKRSIASQWIDFEVTN